MNDDIVKMLRMRACPQEGEYLEHDHGHSDCYLEREAADEIEQLREQMLALEGRLEASREFCDLYRVAICEAIRILENPHLTIGGTSKAYGLLKKAIGQ